jgi:HSP20 family protein
MEDFKVPEIRNVPILDELNAMRRRMDSLFLESFSEPEDESSEAQIEAETWLPLVDIIESEQEWILYADLPGVLEEDLRVEVSEFQLLIAGERKTIYAPEGSSISKVERPEGAFSRIFTLPRNIRKNEINAKLKHGVLMVAVPKERASCPSREIPVKAS